MTDRHQGRSQESEEAGRLEDTGQGNGNHVASTARCTTLVIGDRRLKIAAIAKRLRQEVAVLQIRIATVAAQPDPNTAALQAYEELLHRRLTVLSWLSQYHQPEAETQ